MMLPRNKSARPNWRQHKPKLERLTSEIADSSNCNEPHLIGKLEVIFGPSYHILGVDARVIALIEFCFFKAEGPYSPRFDYFSQVISKILSASRPMRYMLNRTADAAIGNMVLSARGNLQFKISDYYELRRVLQVWRKMGLRARSPHSVFRAILAKREVQERLKNKDIYLMARLKQVFPFCKGDIVPEEMNLSQAIFEHQRQRFDDIIGSWQRKGLSLNQMIQNENTRPMPVGVNRNNLLSYLVKRRWNYRCQVCKLRRSTHSSGHIEAHHIIPLEQGGIDHSSNLIILCKRHHNEAHTNHLIIEPLKKLRITYEGRMYTLDYN